MQQDKFRYTHAVRLTSRLRTCNDGIETRGTEADQRGSTADSSVRELPSIPRPPQDPDHYGWRPTEAAPETFGGGNSTGFVRALRGTRV